MDRAGLDFVDFWRALKHRKLYLLAAVIVGGAAAVAISQALPVHYTSEALLEVEANSPLTRELNPTTFPTTAEQVRTEVDILQSRALTDQVIQELHLADDPSLKAAQRPPTWIDWMTIKAHAIEKQAQELLGIQSAVDPADVARDLFDRRLEVLANERSHIVGIRFQSGSPTLSAIIVNTLLKDYLARQVGANQAVSEQENQWLTEHLKELQRAMDEAAQRAQAFRDANGLVDIQAGALPAVQLNEREQALSNARQELAKAQAAYDTAKAAQKTGGFVGQEALGSQLIQRLQERQAEVMQRMANLRQRAGENSVYMQPVQAELSTIRQQIASETAKIVASLRRDVELAKDRVASLQATVVTSQAQARHNVAAAAVLAQLNQDVEAKRHVYTAFLTRMEQTQLASTKFPSVRVVSPAVPPAKSDGMAPWIVGVLGAMAALFLTMAIVLLRHVMSGRIGSARDVEVLTGVSPIGSMPALPGARGMPIPMRILDMAQTGTVETLHALRFAIQGLNPGGLCTHVLVTSSKSDEGKTTLATSLARLTAASGLRVLLIEADLRRPTLSRVFRTSPKLSMKDVLDGRSCLTDAVHIDRKSGLHCLMVSQPFENPVEALQSPAIGRLIADAGALYDMVIIDSPPVMHVVDALILAKFADIILFAVACGTTTGNMVAEALRRFPREIRPRISTVLTRVPQSEEAWRGYYTGYQHRALTST